MSALPAQHRAGTRLSPHAYEVWNKAGTDLRGMVDLDHRLYQTGGTFDKIVYFKYQALSLDRSVYQQLEPLIAAGQIEVIQAVLDPENVVWECDAAEAADRHWGYHAWNLVESERVALRLDLFAVYDVDWRLLSDNAREFYRARLDRGRRPK